MEPRTYREFVKSIITALESLGITYAIGGSFASSAYGEARTTADIDISIVLPFEDAKRFVAAIQRLGYYVFLDTVLDAMIHKMPFNVIDAVSGYKADIFLVEPTLLEESVLSRRRRVVYDPATNASAMLYSPEDVIIYKLKYFLQGQSQKHPRDIAAMLVVQGASLDYDYIARWAEEIGALDVWNQWLAEYRKRSGKEG
ncbi:MAG: hypothetical protein IT330_11055 [Anaerolineae bacterium]|nr:hypothetical protein [Anaerolineae bacterium]